MAMLKSFLVLAFASCVFAEGETLFEPCNIGDIKCLSKATEDFLEKTCKGIPNYDIKPIDPLIIPELEVEVDGEMGLVFVFKNLNITGLKNQKISDFKMDKDKRSVVLKTKADLNIFGDMDIKFTKKDKKFSGAYTATTTALGTSQYGYSFITKGEKEYFEVGPETNTCEIIGNPDVKLDENLTKALINDPDAQSMKAKYASDEYALRKKSLCKIVETAYITVMHNLRTSARLMPKTSFFNDI